MMAKTYWKNHIMNETEKEQRLFERKLSQNILQGNIDIVRSCVESDLFKQNYKKRWIFEYFSLRCDRPKARNNVHTYSPMIAAVASGSLDMVKLIAKTEPNVYIEEEKGSCALTLAIEKGKRDIFEYIATRYFTDYKDPEYCGKVLLFLLFEKWFEEFEFFKFVSGVDIYTVFHIHHRPLRWDSLSLKNFPLHSLCDHGMHESIAYLLENYDRDTLNFDGQSVMEIEAFFDKTKPKMEYRYYRRKNDYNLSYPATCAEQLLPLSMYDCAMGTWDEGSTATYDKDMKVENRNKTINLILNSNHLSERAIFNKDSDDTGKFIHKCQYERAILLECASICEDEDIYMKIEQLLINVMGKEGAYTFLLNYELCLPKISCRHWEREKERQRRDAKRIDRIVKEGANWKKMMKCGETMICLLVCDFNLIETVCWIYREGSLLTTNTHSHSTFCNQCDTSYYYQDQKCLCTFLNMILDIYLITIYSYKFEKRKKIISEEKHEERLKCAAKLLLILYAAGEDFSRLVKQKNSSYLVKLSKLNNFKNITYGICPYTGPLINDWAELLSDDWYEMYDIKCNIGLNINDPVIFDAVRKAKIFYQPTLQEIVRKQIRDTLKSNFHNTNLFPIVNRLPIPTRFKHFLLFF